MYRARVFGPAAIVAIALFGARTAPAQPSQGETAANQQRSAAAEAIDVYYDGRTVAQWIGDWDANEFRQNQTALRALAAIGEPAVTPLTKLIQDGHRSTGMAIQTLSKMGEAARGALPVLLELAANRNAKDPDGWTWNVSARGLLLSEVNSMGWAADQWVPLLGRIAEDATEAEPIRSRAIHSLGGMGAAAEPVLKELAADGDQATRKSATEALAEVAIAAGRTREDFYREIIDQHPFDPNVPEYLVRMNNRYNDGTMDPTTQRVKALLRDRLAKQPDAEVAFALATIIRNGLSATDLDFAAPTDTVRSKQGRQDPAESYATLAAALEIGLANAAKGSELAGRCGRSLARLRLLQGDWDGMNAALEKIGQQPIPAEMRPSLPAPPLDWTNLREAWKPADEATRSGSSAIELQFEMEGKGFAGAHVLIKRRPPLEEMRRRMMNTGISVDTLLSATQPLEAPPWDGFGYRAADRGMTRYAVSDATGKVRIEGLPSGPIIVEVLIPTSNFSEPGSKWDLLMEFAPGDVRPTWQTRTGGGGRRGDARQVSRTDGPAVVELKEGQTLKYPKFIVRPQMMLNVADWSPVNADDFVLQWTMPKSHEVAFDHYEVEMVLTSPSQQPGWDTFYKSIRTAKVVSVDPQWPVGKMGVDGLRLRPGNIYVFEVRALDRQGNVLARLPATRVWVPWTHRQSLPPDHEIGGDDVPVYHGVNANSRTRFGDGREVDLAEKIATYFQGDANRFEYEYVRLGAAWLDCLNGFAETGQKELEKLAQELPEGNVVRGTARSLLQQLNAGQELPKRLDFVADQ